MSLLHDVYNEPLLTIAALLQTEWDPWREDFPAIDHPALQRRYEMAREHGWTLSRFMPVTPAVA